MKKLLLGLFAVLWGTCACASVETNNNQDYQNYLSWLEDLKKDMIKRGIAQTTIDKVYGENDFYHERPAAVKCDRKQPEFVMTTDAYLNRVVSKTRMKTAREKYNSMKSLWKKLEQTYEVPAEYIVAFWGAETNFGSNFGGYNVIDALTEMSYEPRRADFFKNELFNALKIVEQQNIDYHKMKGSWAGAMGYFQFMPSTYNAYAVDFDDDGIADIWDNFADAAASAENYLTAIGWNKKVPWGWEVRLPWNFDYTLSGRNKLKTVSEWKKMGVQRADKGSWDSFSETTAAVITPEGAKGRAFLVTKNFGKIMQWNRSENYALAIGLLADAAKGKKSQNGAKNNLMALATADVKKIQAFINKTEIADLEEDGQLGSRTKEAIKLLQKKFLLVADGYPDKKLLRKIDNYNDDWGFAVPVQPQKLHKLK